MSAAPPETEDQLHAAVADLLILTIDAPGIASSMGTMWYTVEHKEAHRISALKRARRGVVSGCADIQILCDGRVYMIELKRHDGRLSSNQARMAEHLRRIGIPTAVCRSCDEVLAALDGWRIPRRRIELQGAA